MSSHPAVKIRPFLALLLVAAVSVACSSASKNNSAKSSSAASRKAPSVGAIPVMLDTAGLSLPIDGYLLTYQELNTLTQANLRLTSLCMSRFGFNYNPTPSSTNASNTGTVATDLSRRYGVINPTAAAQSGYHPPASSAGGKVRTPAVSDAEQLVLDAGQGPMTSADMSKSVGATSDQKYGGQSIPDHGCSGEAYRKLYASGGTAGDADLANKVVTDDFIRSQGDDRVKQVFASWSACMSKLGYSYPTPNDAMNDSKFANSVSPTALEIATAKTDVQCKKQTNVVGVWFTVESAYEKASIQQNIAAFNKIKDGIQSELQTASHALG